MRFYYGWIHQRSSFYTWPLSCNSTLLIFRMHVCFGGQVARDDNASFFLVPCEESGAGFSVDLGGGMGVR